MRKPVEVEVVNKTKGTVLGSQVRVANSALSRMVGLLRHRGLDRGTGLLIEPSSGVHTFGMRFPIDVVALDRNRCVRGVWERLGPFRLAALSFRTRSVLELPVGAIRDSQTEVNDQLAICN